MNNLTSYPEFQKMQSNRAAIENKITTFINLKKSIVAKTAETLQRLTKENQAAKTAAAEAQSQLISNELAGVKNPKFEEKARNLFYEVEKTSLVKKAATDAASYAAVELEIELAIKEKALFELENHIRGLKDVAGSDIYSNETRQRFAVAVSEKQKEQSILKSEISELKNIIKTLQPADGKTSEAKPDLNIIRSANDILSEVKRVWTEQENLQKDLLQQIEGLKQRIELAKKELENLHDLASCLNPEYLSDAVYHSGAAGILFPEINTFGKHEQPEQTRLRIRRACKNII